MNTAIKLNNALMPAKGAASETTSVLLGRAIDAFNRGQHYLALQSGKYALYMARKEQSPLRSDICTFLAHLKWMNGHKGTASFFANLALQYLDRRLATYAEDKRYLTDLLGRIEMEETMMPGKMPTGTQLAA